MPLDAWLLLFVSVGLGLTLELLYVRAQRKRGRPARRRDDTAPGERT